MANGLFAGGDGTELNPYLIEDAHDLNAIKNNLTAHYKLINNVDLNTSPYNEGVGWRGIQNFSGVLDGCGKLISNLISLGGGSSGVFQNVSGCTIANLVVDNLKIEGAFKKGGVVAVAINSTIQNIYVTGSISGSSYLGGVVGESNNTIVKNCHSRADILPTGDGAYFGGIVALSVSGSLKNCYAMGDFGNSGRLKGVITSTSSTQGATSSFWDKEKVNISVSKGGTGLTTQEMQTAQTFIDAGWDLELNDEDNPVWILENGEYPKLWFEVNQQSNKYLLKSNSIIYTPTNTELIQASLDPNQLTLEDFEAHGVEDLSLIVGNLEGEFPMSEIGELEGMKLLSYRLFGFEDIEALEVREVK